MQPAVPQAHLKDPFGCQGIIKRAAAIERITGRGKVKAGQESIGRRNINRVNDPGRIAKPERSSPFLSPRFNKEVLGHDRLDRAAGALPNAVSVKIFPGLFRLGKGKSGQELELAGK